MPTDETRQPAEPEPLRGTVTLPVEDEVIFRAADLVAERDALRAEVVSLKGQVALLEADLALAEKAADVLEGLHRLALRRGLRAAILRDLLLEEAADALRHTHPELDAGQRRARVLSDHDAEFRRRFAEAQPSLEALTEVLSTREGGVLAAPRDREDLP